MEVARAHAVLKGFISELQDNALLRLFESFSQAVTTSASSPNPDNDRVFRERLTEFHNVASSVPSNDWPPSKREILEKLGLDLFTGIGLERVVMTIIEKNQFAPSSAANEITKVLEKVRASVKQTQSLCTQLESLGQQPATLTIDEIELGLLIPVPAGQDTFVQVQKRISQWSRQIDLIGRILLGEPPPHRVISISSGSVEIFIQTTLEYADTITQIVINILTIFALAQQKKKVAKSAETEEFPQELLQKISSHIEEMVESKLAELKDQLIARSGRQIEPDERENLRRALIFLAKELAEGAQVEVSTGAKDTDAESGDEHIKPYAQLAARSKDLVRQLRSPRGPLKLPPPDDDVGGDKSGT